MMILHASLRSTLKL
uniref:Uncharacterized protein n=1 Tax=Arundo donax TaxID=35708 RepID=A0A0A9E6A8_ARUDO